MSRILRPPKNYQSICWRNDKIMGVLLPSKILLWREKVIQEQHLPYRGGHLYLYRITKVFLRRYECRWSGSYWWVLFSHCWHRYGPRGLITSYQYALEILQFLIPGLWKNRPRTISKSLWYNPRNQWLRNWHLWWEEQRNSWEPSGLPRASRYHQAGLH